MTSEAGVRLEWGQLALWRPERGQKGSDCNPHVKVDKPWKFHRDKSTNGRYTAWKQNGNLKMLQSTTYTASVCNVIYFSSCVSAICWLICMKLSGFVYFEMGIEVQPFPTSIRPLNGQLASLQPHSGLQGYDSLNKNCSTFDFRTSYGKKFWIFNV